MTETRKIAAILAADVVGYSRLAGADEEGTLARLRALRGDFIDPSIAVHHGRIVKRTGDGTLVEFRSVVDAVRCALEVQRGMVDRNAHLASDHRIVLRVGVHLGDVVEEADGDLMGDGVNVAARLEGICEPGGLCLSGAAYEQVRDRLKENFTDLGEKPLKNIARPVRIYGVSPIAITGAKTAAATLPRSPKAEGLSLRLSALAAALALAVLAAGAYAWHAGFLPRLLGATVADDKPKSAPRLSIVVLPFQNLGGDPEQEYFADGITDDLTTDLSHLQGSFVISHSTALTYKSKPLDAKQIGRELGVRYVLEGSVRRVGDKVAVNAQLISTESGAHLWADRFDGERGRLGELQVEFVSRLANSLGVELVKAEALRSTRERPNNPDSIDLAMRAAAKLLSGAWGKSTVNEAIDLYERALAADANNVPAMTGLAGALTGRVRALWSDHPENDTARAEKTIDSALTVEPDNSAAHLAKAWVLGTKQQWGSAIVEAETAISEDSNNAEAHAAASLFKMFLGRSEDGFAGVETALRLSPRDPGLPGWQFYMCHLYAHLAQWTQAIEWCDKSVAGDPQNWYPLVDLVAANAWSGHDKEARDAAAQLQKVYPGFTVQTWAGIHWTDDPTFNAQYARIVEGLRKAGLPEGDKKAD